MTAAAVYHHLHCSRHHSDHQAECASGVACARRIAYNCGLQVENEYGFCGSEKAYLRHLVASARRHLGNDTILYTTDPPAITPKGSLYGDEVYTCAFFIQKPSQTKVPCLMFSVPVVLHWLDLSHPAD